MDFVAQLVVTLVLAGVYAFAGAVLLRISARWVLRENFPIRTAFTASWLAGFLAFLLMLPVLGVLVSVGEDAQPWMVVLSVLAVCVTAQSAANKVAFECSVLSSILISITPLLIILGLVALIVGVAFAHFSLTEL